MGILLGGESSRVADTLAAGVTTTYSTNSVFAALKEGGGIMTL